MEITPIVFKFSTEVSGVETNLVMATNHRQNPDNFGPQLMMKPLILSGKITNPGNGPAHGHWQIPTNFGPKLLMFVRHLIALHLLD